MCAGVVQLETQTNVGTHKKAKVKEQETMTLAAADDLSVSAGGEPTSNSQHCIVDNLKKRSEHKTGDLPVPSDQRWSRSVIGTLTLWCGTQPDIWVILDEAFVKALQDIFKAVYPESKHRVVINGAVHAMVRALLEKCFDTCNSIYRLHNAYPSGEAALDPEPLQ